MQIEYKAVSTAGFKVLDETNGIVSTVVSVTGIKDNVNDNIEPGAYTKTLKARTPKGVWSHAWEKPISKTLAIKELMPGDPGLPKKLSNNEPWPMNAGGLLVKTQFNLGTQRGREAYSDVMFFKDQQEWSIGYRVPQGCAEIDSETGERKIKELELYEYSPVLFGAMPHARSQGVKSVRDAQAEYKHFLAGEEEPDAEQAWDFSNNTKEDKVPQRQKQVPVMRTGKSANRELLLTLKSVVESLLERKDDGVPADVDLFEFADAESDTDVDDTDVDDELEDDTGDDEDDTDAGEEKTVMETVLSSIDTGSKVYAVLVKAAYRYDQDPTEDNAVKLLDLLEVESKSDPEGVALVAAALMDEAKAMNNETAEEEEDDDETANDESDDIDDEGDVTDEDTDGDDAQKVKGKKALEVLKGQPTFGEIKSAMESKDTVKLSSLLGAIVADTDDVKVLEAASDVLDVATDTKQVSWMDDYYAKAEVSTTPWSNFSTSDYSDEQYKAACLIDRGGDTTTKSRCSLPVKEPNGKLNKHAVIAAAGRLGATKDISDDQRKAAAKKLVSLYRNQLQMDPPEALVKAAGEDQKDLFTVDDDFDTKSLEELLDTAMAGVYGEDD